jgi:hypothetical protein
VLLRSVEPAALIGNQQAPELDFDELINGCGVATFQDSLCCNLRGVKTQTSLKSLRFREPRLVAVWPLPFSEWEVTCTFLLGVLKFQFVSLCSEYFSVCPSLRSPKAKTPQKR